MKQLVFLAAITLAVIGASACTREKPPEPTVVTPVAQASVAVTPVAPAVVTEIPTMPTDTPVITATLVMPPPSPVVTGTIPAPVVTSTPTTPLAGIPGPSGAPGTYTVQWGDWLSKISARFGVTNQDIIAANPGINPNRIYPGMVLHIPAPGSTNPPPTGSTPTAPNVPPATGNPSTYTVQRGEWLYSIARKFGITVSALLAANPGTNPNFVYPGQVLNIPGGGPNPNPNPSPSPNPNPGPGNTYVVAQGDTLFSIAVRFHTTAYAIQIANHLPNPNFIYPGQTLIIPQ